MSEPKLSSLFRFIEKLQGERPWGRYLDAGTGPHSIRWIRSLETTAWTAVTASPQMAERVRAGAGAALRSGDRIVVGNWGNEKLLEGERFDTVLMDYLVGAIEGYAPYGQDQIFERLRPHVAGRLYLTGVEPYVPLPAATDAGRLVRRIGSLRDACLLLAGERPYREFPLDWIRRQLGRAGFRVVASRSFPNIYRAAFVNGQLDLCIDRLERIGSRELAEAMRGEIEALRREALVLASSEEGLRHGADYVIAAEPIG
ncbi:MAG: class I SAM-dependent methyltransferase [Gammaproteobacteria bacterium]|jgi:hypothetical protein|nr:class I SAM-dependent methyltransferase [Gammaproteobacteria bacterium]